MQFEVFLHEIENKGCCVCKYINLTLIRLINMSVEQICADPFPSFDDIVIHLPGFNDKLSYQVSALVLQNDHKMC